MWVGRQDLMLATRWPLWSAALNAVLLPRVDEAKAQRLLFRSPWRSVGNECLLTLVQPEQ